MMNEQEMQFADPDWKPTGSLSAPSAQTITNAAQPVSVAGPVNKQAYDDASLPAYDQGYRGSWQEDQHFPLPQPSMQQVPYQALSGRVRGRSRWWIWVIIAVIFFALMGGMFRSSSISHAGFKNPGFQQAMPVQSKQVYDMQGAIELDINDLGGNVTVQVTNDDSQSVVVAADPGSQPQVNYQGQKMVLTSGGDITVFMPSSVALHLSAGVSDVEVDNFSGLLTAQTNSGAITLNNDTLSQGSSLNTNSGNIDIGQQSSVSDTTITSQTGAITLDQTNLSGQVTISTGGNGTIDYTGALDPQGKYQFTTDSGSIDLNLPQNTAMQMKIAQKSGSYHSDFAPTTGSSPQASVGVTTNSGDITISQE